MKEEEECQKEKQVQHRGMEMQAQGVRESTLFVTDRVWGARLVKEKGKVGEAKYLFYQILAAPTAQWGRKVQTGEKEILQWF